MHNQKQKGWMYVALVNPVLKSSSPRGSSSRQVSNLGQVTVRGAQIGWGAVLLDWKDLDRQISDFAPKNTLNI